MDFDAPTDYQDLDSTDTAYHSISALAIVALVIGLLSPLAFVHPLLWALPVTGIALAWVSIARIDRSEGVLIGRKAAIVGLAISLFCGLGATAHSVTRQLWLAHRAELIAERFLELLREGKTHEAHQMFARPEYRALPGSDLAAHYDDNKAASDDYERFLKREVISDLVELGEDAEIEHLRTRLTATDPNMDYLMVFYRMSGSVGTEPIDKEIRLVVARMQDQQLGERWQVIADEEVVE